jgi:ADP-ribose pyrophosphatase
VVAVTEQNELVLVEQYRAALGKRVIEMPAGLAGDEPGLAHEAWAEAARRELLEETGCFAPTMEYLAAGPSSAGMTDETYALYLARGVRRTERGGGGVAGENLRVHFVPLERVEAWLDQQVGDGLLIDPKIYAGLFFARRQDG